DAFARKVDEVVGGLDVEHDLGMGALECLKSRNEPHVGKQRQRANAQRRGARRLGAQLIGSTADAHEGATDHAQKCLALLRSAARVVPRARTEAYQGSAQARAPGGSPLMA